MCQGENAIIVRYWVATDHRPFPDLEGIGDFRKELSDAYVSIVHGLSGKMAKVSSKLPNARSAPVPVPGDP
jgi:hypothetical protein